MSTVKGLWTKAELAEAQRLARACEASDAHWAFGDWLLLKEPMARSGIRTGMNARLMELAATVDLTWDTLRWMRSVAYAWPVQHRVQDASFYAHGRSLAGGPNAAAERAQCLSSGPRDRLGRVISTPVRELRRTTSLHVDFKIYEGVVTVADADRSTIKAAAEGLIREALEARAWLASEIAA